LFGVPSKKAQTGSYTATAQGKWPCFWMRLAAAPRKLTRYIPMVNLGHLSKNRLD
jgi:hypothetical protein